MGKALKGTTVKLDGQSGPLGKGVPLIKAAGPGGLIGLARGNRVNPSRQVPSYKPLIQKEIERGKIKPVPAHGRSFLKPRSTSILNPDGSRSSERTATVNVEEINQGRATNIPTIYGGKQRTVPDSIRRIIESKVDPETGRYLRGYESVDEAVKAAGRRSRALGALPPGQSKPLP